MRHAAKRHGIADVVLVPREAPQSGIGMRDPLRDRVLTNTDSKIHKAIVEYHCIASGVERLRKA